MLEVRCSDASGTLSLKWFHAPRGLETRLVPGAQVMVTGAVKKYLGNPEMIHPELNFGLSAATTTGSSSEANPSENVGRVVPIYTEIEGIPSRTLRKVLWDAVQRFASELTEDLPSLYLNHHHLPSLGESIKALHFPSENQGNIADLLEFKTPAHHRLIYEEFFKFEFLILRQRLRMEKALAPTFGKDGGLDAVRSLEKMLPFSLTGDQSKAVTEILEDFQRPHPMNRLIQGDVGSGKTAVSLLAAGGVLAEGGQAALMAPTEILAEQHYRTAVKIFGGKLNVLLLTGKTPASERTLILGRLISGEPVLLIGTHALIEDPVVFKNLSFVMVDEQHRFGVEQRRTLRQKGSKPDPKTGRTILPHSLILTATPIPRTLALTAYGDLSVSSIKELPPGRSPVKTFVVRDKTWRTRAYEKIREEIRAGHQAYFIYPLVNDSEAEGFTHLKSAVTETERLATEIFPEFKLGLLHGQMKSDEKANVMDRFKRGELQILVSTTVVEVGVDVPNATIMAIEHAERFGLSQLHQLRGRVGRGQAQSHCFLFAPQRTGEATAERLEVLEKTQDGFEIAEADLEIRGPGEFLGTRQAGGLPFRLANLIRDREWLIKARDDASDLLRTDPDLALNSNHRLRAYFEREGKLQFERLKTS
jgi:ATP-dependent DNA helicase RecG